MTYNTKNLDNIETLIDDLENEIMDREWDGQNNLEWLYDELQDLYKQRTNGVLYIPRF